MVPSPARELPLWLKILLNICGPLGVGLALLGYLNAWLGILFLIGTTLYVSWELYPGAAAFVKRRPRLSLPIFLSVGLAMGLCAWFLLLRISPQIITPTITKNGGFTILIPIDTANRNMPIPLDENPEDPHSKFYRALTFSITDRHPDKASGYLMLEEDQLLSDDGRPKFLGKLILMYTFESVFTMTRESYGVELSRGKVTPIENKAVIPPDVVSSPTNHVIADLSKRHLLNGSIESLLKNFPLHMPKGTNVTFSEHLERESAVYIMRMERPGFFRFDLSVRPIGSSNQGVLPNKFQTQAAKTVKTYDLIVAMDSVIQATSADGFEADKYTIWVQDTLTELRRRMTF